MENVFFVPEPSTMQIVHDIRARRFGLAYLELKNESLAKVAAVLLCIDDQELERDFLDAIPEMEAVCLGWFPDGSGAALADPLGSDAIELGEAA